MSVRFSSIFFGKNDSLEIAIYIKNGKNTKKIYLENICLEDEEFVLFIFHYKMMSATLFLYLALFPSSFGLLYLSSSIGFLYLPKGSSTVDLIID